MTPSEEIKRRWELLRRDREETPEMAKEAAVQSSFWSGFEKTAAGAARVDRMIAALKGRKLPTSRVHGALRGLDLKNQMRGLSPGTDTAITRAAESAAKSQAAGGFKAAK